MPVFFLLRTSYDSIREYEKGAQYPFEYVEEGIILLAVTGLRGYINRLYGNENR